MRFPYPVPARCPRGRICPPEPIVETLSLMEPRARPERIKRLSDFVAYVDESGNGGPVFVAGSLFAQPGQGAVVPHRWRGGFAAPPAPPDFSPTQYPRA